MKLTPESVRKFTREALSEADGKASFSRIITTVVVAFAMGWVTVIVRHNFALPDFGGLALLIGTLYGINQVGKVVGDRAGEQQKKFLDDLTTASATPASPTPATPKP